MCYARRQRSSWARIKLSKSWYQNTDLRPWFNRFRVLLLALYFCLSSILILELFEIRSHILYMLCTSLLLFNFQGSVPPSKRRLAYYTTSAPSCQVFFRFFFKKFLDEEQILILSDASLPIIPCLWRLVKGFSADFSLFFVFVGVVRFAWKAAANLCYFHNPTE